MIIKIKKLSDDAVIPVQAYWGDAGLDLCSVEDSMIGPGDFKLIRTGLAIELPPATEAQIRPRSGLALKYGITLLNAPGTIDEAYRGEIGVILINHGKQDFAVTKGMKIAQMVVKKTYEADLVECDVLSESDRGSGGFGSSG